MHLVSLIVLTTVSSLIVPKSILAVILPTSIGYKTEMTNSFLSSAIFLEIFVLINNVYWNIYYIVLGERAYSASDVLPENGVCLPFILEDML